MKFLLWGLIVAAVLLWFWHGRRRAAGPRKDGDVPGSATEKMVRCAHCGVHLPASEAVSGAAGLYCSNEHRRLAGES